MKDVDPPQCDLLCASCGYSLRGCDATNQCPECGYPVSLTLAQKVGSRGNIEYLEKLASAAKSIRAPIAAAQFIERAMQRVVLARSAMGLTVGHVTANDICEAVVELIEERADSAKRRKQLLHAMEFHTSADVGKMVWALVAAGLLSPTGPNDSQASFEELDVIERWLEK